MYDHYDTPTIKNGFQSRIDTSSKIHKQPHGTPTNNRRNWVEFDNQKINQQLNDEIKQLSAIISSCNSLLTGNLDKRVSKNSIENILSMEEIIEDKDRQIKDINKEIKMLKNADNNAVNRPQNNKLKKEDQKVFKLCREVREEKEVLVQQLESYTERYSHFEKLKQAIHTIQNKYIDRCKKANQRYISYSDFREMIEEKRKRNNPAGKKKKFRKPSIKGIIEMPSTFDRRPEPDKVSKANHYDHERDEPDKIVDTKNLSNLQHRKKIAQTALKNQRKKHDLELHELTAKIEFLRDEDNLLEHNFKEKKMELETLEKKFNQTKNSSSTEKTFKPVKKRKHLMDYGEGR